MQDASCSPSIRFGDTESHLPNARSARRANTCCSPSIRFGDTESSTHGIERPFEQTFAAAHRSALGILKVLAPACASVCTLGCSPSIRFGDTESTRQVDRRQPAGGLQPIDPLWGY